MNDVSSLRQSITTPVEAKEYVAKGTGFHVFLGFFGLIFGFLILTLATSGIALLGLLILLLFSYWQSKKAHAILHGSGLRLSESQMPTIYASVVNQSKRLGMKEVPEVYIIEDNSQNAFALKHGNKSHVVLVDDLVYGALMTKKPKVIDFIIGHELAHHALGHTNTLRGMIRNYFRPLSRLDEFSCDAVAHALVDDPEVTKDALMMMLVGPHLTKLVNHESFEHQVQEVAKNRYSRKGERILSHPLLLRRYARILDPDLK